VRVKVHQTRKAGGMTEIDVLASGRNGDICADAVDTAVAHDDRCIDHGLFRAHIYQTAAMNGDNLGALCVRGHGGTQQ